MDSEDDSNKPLDPDLMDDIEASPDVDVEEVDLI